MIKNMKATLLEICFNMNIKTLNFEVFWKIPVQI